MCRSRTFSLRGQRPVILVAAYDGVLQVENPDPLRRLLRDGIGQA
ncbi:hypothetical protein [Micromonospora sp. NBC_01796]|nr:hypothetical protein [Micromonospora sp. NBC_01796]WSA83878.1 type I-E CRISPR-associated protein Cas6/Cse3/CasE [Micromonospora sp. NBC_01796]